MIVAPEVGIWRVAQDKSFARLFKGGRVQRQRLWSRLARREIPPGTVIVGFAANDRPGNLRLPRPRRQNLPGEKGFERALMMGFDIIQLRRGLKRL